MPLSKTSKQSKRAALAALRSARDGTAAASGLDSVRFAAKDEEDVYETMGEAQYRDYVEKKRQREDFVVDDGALSGGVRGGRGRGRGTRSWTRLPPRRTRS